MLTPLAEQRFSLAAWSAATSAISCTFACAQAAKISRAGKWADKPRRRYRFSLRAGALNHPALRHWRKETIAVVAVFEWLWRRRG